MILCCGEALIDMIPAPTSGGGRGFLPQPGGGALNTAIALGRLGQSVGLVTALSIDMFGQQLAGALTASHVDLSGAARVDRPTTLAFVQLRDGQPEYAFYDENSAGRMLGAAELPPLPEAAETLCFGGISLACEPGADAYADLLSRHGAGRVVLIDPNIRPALVRDQARYRDRLGMMMARADILRLSDEDLGWLYPEAPDLRTGARSLLALGPALVVVTRGAEGAEGYLPDGTAVSVPAPQVTVADTVGAGDTFIAGLLASLSDQGLLSPASLARLDPDQLKVAMTHAARVAAIAVSRAGSNPPWAHELAMPHPS
ncbi:carbohydrate kinase [Ruegeria pomeroyi]|uniref:carbohydrate kinase family protein n=1 Tax=Ruegeria pomeroyi TaxID=89184 RepID=UPI001F36FB5D|nr:carbohydrate kinase [Ruegeria pomeroyi]MCE8509711.1 carbohydrate kinase [Ruegeria pomeroyi]